jgi:hypothetical protein
MDHPPVPMNRSLKSITCFYVNGGELCLIFALIGIGEGFADLKGLLIYYNTSGDKPLDKLRALIPKLK